MKHLQTKLIPLLDESEEKRIDFILKGAWIGYPKAQEIFDQLNFLLRHPRIARMPSLLLVGETNNGKTNLLKRFIQLNKPYLDKPDDQVIVPVLYIQAPPVPDEKRLYNAILDSTYTPYRVNDKLDKRQHQVLNVIKHIKTKILIIDEIHHVLGGTMSRRTSFLNVIKYLSNETSICIVGAGTKDAFSAISTDAQLMNRFEPSVLPKWKYNHDYLRLLASYEQIIPLKKPSLIYQNPQIAKIILMLSEGTIGEISTIIKRAAVVAIENNTEQLTVEIIKSLNFVPPSERRFHSKFIDA